jgi:tetratricopeptide (TPR) repeat protein
LAAIFISHSSRDNELAAQMKAWLDQQGYEQVFLDFDKHSGLQAGEHWERELYEKIARCHAVILILTPNWLDSKWCFVEFAQARALGKIIFPVVLSPLGGRHVAPEIQGVDLRDWNAEGQDYLRRRIHEVSDEAARGFPWDRARSPYPGIHSFDAEDAAVFFGRDLETWEVIERLEARRVQGGRRLLLIIGASGSGKSSLLKAGILPQLARERSHWIALSPFRPERQPLANFAKTIAETLGQPQAWRDWRERLAGGNAIAALKEALDNLRLGDARHATLLISVDQFEEIFTIAEAGERTAFLDLVRRGTDMAGDPLFLVVATVRPDVLGELLQAQQFALPFDSYALRPMPLDRLAKIIEGPAAVAAVTLEKGLTQRISEDVKTTEALPLLAFALREFYERYGKHRRLTLSDYAELGDQADSLNPIENAVRRRADDVLAMLSPTAEELAAFKQAFVPFLVRIRDSDTFLRQPARLAALPPAARRLIDAFVEARLLSKQIEPGADAQEIAIEVSHEALFKAWPLLAKWLNEERAFLAGKVQLGRLLEDWDNAPAAQKPAALLQGLNLTRARQWLQTHRGGLSHAEVSFIQASDRRQRARKIASYGLASAALLVLATVGASWVYGEFVRRTAHSCDLLAAETDNNVFVPGVEDDRIDTKAAIPACEEAVKRDPDNPRLMHNLARSLDAAGRYEDAAFWYRQAADRNWPWSQNNLGILYLYGRGVPLNFKRGVELLRAAAEQNNANAKRNYEGQDFSILFKDNSARAKIVQNALVERGFLQPADVDGVWGSPTEAALESFKRSAQISDPGLSLRVIDRLGIVDQISGTIGRG